MSFEQRVTRHTHTHTRTHARTHAQPNPVRLVMAAVCILKGLAPAKVRV
jgi:hypothetical protein